MNSDTPPENWICATGAAMGERIGAQQADALRRRRAAAHRLEQLVGHQSGQRAALVERQHAADLQIDAELRAVAPAGVFDARDLAVRLKTDEPRADIDRGNVDHLAVGADRDLGGAAADIDVHHHAFVADRARRRARAIGRHHGFEAVAGADRDQLAGLLGEQVADGARVASAAPRRRSGSARRCRSRRDRPWRPCIPCSMKAPSASASMVFSAE